MKRDHRAAWLTVAVVALALASSFTGVFNDFVLDDNLAIVANARVHTLHAPWAPFTQSYWPAELGGGLYRPLTILLFALQWTVGGAKPLVFHMVSLGLYLGLAALVYRLALAVLPPWPAWIAAAFFAVHPVHVEAVANAVGQAELTVALCVVLSVALYIEWRREAPGKPLAGRRVAALLLLYLTACAAKEHAIVLPALLLLTEMTVVADQRPLAARLAAERACYLALVAGAGLFLAARWWVLGAITRDVSALGLRSLGAGQRALTTLSLIPQWLRLFYWPVHLRADYSPQETVVVLSPDLSTLVGVTLLAAILGLAILLRRRKPVLSFGIGWVIIALLPTSNLLFPTGILMAERTLMLPSVGAVLVMGGVLQWAAEESAVMARSAHRRIAMVLIALLLAGGGFRSALRQRIWSTDEAVRASMVMDAPASAWGHWLYGNYLFRQGRRDIGEQHILTAIRLDPSNWYVVARLGEYYQAFGFCRSAVNYLSRALVLAPDQWSTRLRLVSCLLDTRQFAAARRQAQIGIQRGEQAASFHAALVSIDSTMVAEAVTR